MSAIWLSSKGLNMMMSSTRFKNSGRMNCFSCSMTSLRVFSKTSSALLSVSRAKLSWMTLAPMLEVMMTMVFLKSTVRPLLSVRRPSSKTCNRMLNTSGCAFSISSSRMTE